MKNGGGWEIFIFYFSDCFEEQINAGRHIEHLEIKLPELNDIYPNENQVVLGKNVGIKIHHNFSFFFNIFFY